MFGHDKGLYVLGVILKLKNKRMLLSVAADNMEIGINKLIADSEKAFLLLSDESLISNPDILIHHQSFCEANENSLAWLYQDGEGIKYESNKLTFTIREFSLELWDNTTAYVVSINSKQLQKLYYGNSHLKNINRNRLRQFTGAIKINRGLHPLL